MKTQIPSSLIVVVRSLEPPFLDSVTILRSDNFIKALCQLKLNLVKMFCLAILDSGMSVQLLLIVEYQKQSCLM